MADDALLTIERLVLPPNSSGGSLRLTPGELRIVLLPGEDLCAALLHLILGLRSPLSGEVSLLGVPLQGLSVRHLMALRCRIGTVVQRGGLLSNLKVWENLTLSSAYHRAGAPASVDEGLAALSRVGYGGGPMEPSGRLTLVQRKQVMVARVLLNAPELVLCDSLTTGIAQSEGEQLLSALLEYRQRQPRSALLFLTADPSFVARLPGAAVSELCGGTTDDR